jgi:hypothetical protein
VPGAQREEVAGVSRGEIVGVAPLHAPVGVGAACVERPHHEQRHLGSARGKEPLQPSGPEEDPVRVDAQVAHAGAQDRAGVREEALELRMHRGIAQPLVDDVIEAAAVLGHAAEDALVKRHVEETLGDAVHVLPALRVGRAHAAREVAAIGGLDLQDAEVTREDGHGTHNPATLGTRRRQA